MTRATRPEGASDLSSGSGYAPPGEQVTNLSVTVRDNLIGGTQDWDGPTAGNQPAYFRAAIALDQGAGSIAGNELRGRDYDAFLRFTNGARGILTDRKAVLLKIADVLAQEDQAA